MATRKTASSGTRKTSPADSTKKSATRKSVAKKSASRKSVAEKSPAKKSPAKKGARKTAATDERSTSSARTSGGSRTSRRSAPRAASAKKPSGARIAAEAARQLLELTGRDIEGVTGFQRTEDGWTVEVEVLEVRRIPDTTDVLALYEVTVDDDGEMEGYRRLRRYTRGHAGEE